MYSDEVLFDPYPHYRQLRDLGPVVWLESNKLWVVPRYKEMRAALLNPEVFISGRGVSANEPANQASSGTTLCSDAPLHDQLRKFVMKPLLPKSLTAYIQLFESEADGLVARLLELESFDAVTDFSHHLPLTVVRDLVGLTDEGRENMLEWGAAGFNVQGVMNARAMEQLETIQAIAAHAAACCADPEEKLAAGGLGRRVCDGGESGEIPKELTPSVLLDYIIPSLDTTVLGTASTVLLLAQNPDQWDLIRSAPDLIPNAINEALRLESPARGFTRYVAQDYEVEGVTLEEGSRVWTPLPSGNRDERIFEDPDVFSVERTNASQHLAFGMGSHICAGMHLAKLEIGILLKTLVDNGVKRIELVGRPVYRPNNTLYGLKTLPVRFIT